MSLICQMFRRAQWSLESWSSRRSGDGMHLGGEGHSQTVEGQIFIEYILSYCARVFLV